MSIQLQSDFPYNDEAGWSNFLSAHYFEHQKIIKAIQQKYFFASLDYPLLDIGDQKIWLFSHADMHQSISKIIGIGLSPDLDEVDFSKEDQFETWMQNHAALHDQIDLVLGL